MRNAFGTKEKPLFGLDNNKNQSDSPDQLAVVWSAGEEIVAASPSKAEESGIYDLDIARFPDGFNLTAAIGLRRASFLDLPPLSEQTQYLTIASDYSERTRILALSGEVLALNDDELIEWLLNAEKQMSLGIDSHPVFETALEETACSIARLPNGLVAMTEVPRRHIKATRSKILSLLGEETPAFVNLTVETPIRCAARYFLSALPEGAVALRNEKQAEVSAFILIGKGGFSYGLWSPSIGLFSEYGFSAPKEINRMRTNNSADVENFQYESISPGNRVFNSHPAANQDTPEENNESKVQQEQLQIYISDAFDQLFLQLSFEKLEQLNLSNYSQVIWSAGDGLSDLVAATADAYSENTGLGFFRLPAQVDEIVAGGLLFGSFSFGDTTAVGAQIIPPVNMARDILALADREEIERRQMEDQAVLRHRNRTVFALLATPIIVLAGLLALSADLFRTQFMLGMREANADARTLELKPAVERRKSYEANLKWYQEFVTQVSGLRRQQPVGIGLLYELNTNYPFDVDPSFYVSDLKLGGGLTGNEKCFDCVEIKGFARNKDAVTSFLRSLEFAGGPQSGSKLFSNLAYEVQEKVATGTAAPPGSQSIQPALTGSGLTRNDVAPGIIAWSLKGNFVPLAEFAPPDKDKKPATVPPPPNVPPPNPAPKPAS